MLRKCINVNDVFDFQMATLSLRISIVERDVTKTMQFDPTISVYNACRLIREKISEANLDQRKFT